MENRFIITTDVVRGMPADDVQKAWVGTARGVLRRAFCDEGLRSITTFGPWGDGKLYAPFEYEDGVYKAFKVVDGQIIPIIMGDLLEAAGTDFTCSQEKLIQEAQRIHEAIHRRSKVQGTSYWDIDLTTKTYPYGYVTIAGREMKPGPLVLLGVTVKVYKREGRVPGDMGVPPDVFELCLDRAGEFIRGQVSPSQLDDNICWSSNSSRPPTSATATIFVHPASYVFDDIEEGDE